MSPGLGYHAQSGRRSISVSDGRRAHRRRSVAALRPAGPSAGDPGRLRVGAGSSVLGGARVRAGGRRPRCTWPPAPDPGPRSARCGPSASCCFSRWSSRPGSRAAAPLLPGVLPGGHHGRGRRSGGAGDAQAGRRDRRLGAPGAHDLPARARAQPRLGPRAGGTPRGSGARGDAGDGARLSLLPGASRREPPGARRAGVPRDQLRHPRPGCGRAPCSSGRSRCSSAWSIARRGWRRRSKPGDSRCPAGAATASPPWRAGEHAAALGTASRSGVSLHAQRPVRQCGTRSTRDCACGAGRTQGSRCKAGES